MSINYLYNYSEESRFIYQNLSIKRTIYYHKEWKVSFLVHNFQTAYFIYEVPLHLYEYSLANKTYNL